MEIKLKILMFIQHQFDLQFKWFVACSDKFSAHLDHKNLTIWHSINKCIIIYSYNTEMHFFVFQMYSTYMKTLSSSYWSSLIRSSTSRSVTSKWYEALNQGNHVHVMNIQFKRPFYSVNRKSHKTCTNKTVWGGSVK